MKTSLIAQLLSTFAYVMLINNLLAKASFMAGIRVNMKRNSKVIQLRGMSGGIGTIFCKPTTKVKTKYGLFKSFDLST